VRKLHREMRRNATDAYDSMHGGAGCVDPHVRICERPMRMRIGLLDFRGYVSCWLQLSPFAIREDADDFLCTSVVSIMTLEAAVSPDVADCMTRSTARWAIRSLAT
jgi:hypothetical protein